jgi:hypothetical protein
MAKAKPVTTHFGNGLTPTSAQRRQAAAPDSTKAPSGLRNPGRASATPGTVGAGETNVSLTAHTRPAVVTGPTSWENCDSPSTPSGKPPLRGPSSPGWPDSDGDYDGD